MSETAALSPLSSAPALPEGVRAGSENLVRLTEPAGAKVSALIARERAGELLRIAITGGGCNGLSFKMKFVPEARRGDILVRTAGVPVVVDPKTALEHTRRLTEEIAQRSELLTANERAEHSLQCGAVEEPFQAHRPTDIIKGGPGLDLVREPYPQLRRRGRRLEARLATGDGRQGGAVTTVSGQKQRLRLLGYQIGHGGPDGNGVDNNAGVMEFERSVLNLQAEHNATTNAVVDANTQTFMTNDAGV